MTNPSRSTRHEIRITHYALRIIPPCLFLLPLFLLVACSLASSEPQPPDIAYGQEMCDACGMLISEPGLAAATLLADNQSRKFYDIGDMFQYQRDHPELSVRAWFVHDYKSEGWIRGETATYVVVLAGRTPMASGLVAFVDRSAAENYANDQGGKTLPFEEARTLPLNSHGQG